MKTHLNKIIITSMLSTLITCFSCEKMLETDVPENQMQSQTVFENVQTANSVLSGLYAGLFDASPVSGDQSGYCLSMYTDDTDFYALSNTSGLLEIAGNTLIDSNNTTATFWASSYQKIYLCNTILEGIEDSKGIPEADKNRIKGEALTIRSLLLFYLQQLYGDIPYPVTTNYMINQSISKTPSQEVFFRLETDLQEASGLLPDTYRHAERIFINKKAAQLLLGKVYMRSKANRHRRRSY
ncbi:RagB/SusD family nutrient uptake outer membrane protein [Chryseobacterium formosus]|uniref:RagB/SusD family nutrient uptake outer membrane protein n=1 Tax=Chryseobacterium formosus TaxID=1537363 RepID=A0ABT3XW42_9FLAO|nr:RagB/SusD family nutrient uptake outer membrane protein [Chryseobacterium formosus]MCX8525896.1 RagB/SusD family nutrient uptake outer membrane protein [Chryseobacterium formosus]